MLIHTNLALTHTCFNNNQHRCMSFPTIFHISLCWNYINKILLVCQISFGLILWYLTINQFSIKYFSSCTVFTLNSLIPEFTSIYNIKDKTVLVHMSSNLSIMRQPRKCLFAQLCVHLYKQKSLQLNIVFIIVIFYTIYLAL